MIEARWPEPPYGRANSRPWLWLIWALLLPPVLVTLWFAAGEAFEAYQVVCTSLICSSSQLAARDLPALFGLRLSLPIFAGLRLSTDILVALAVIASSAATLTARRDLYGLLLSAAMLVNALTLTALLGPLQGLSPGWATWASLLALIGQVGMVFFLATFPSGRFVPPWMAVAWALWSIWLAVNAAGGLPDWMQSSLNLIVTSVFLGLGLAAQGYRYYHLSTPVERLQSKWVIFALVIVFVFYLLINLGESSLHLFTRGGPLRLALVTLVPSLLDASLIGVAAALAVSMLRWRLWDIDVMIGSTVTHGFLISAVGATLFFSAAGLRALAEWWPLLPVRALLIPLTLGLVLLYAPLHQRVTLIIDRILYRRRLDARLALRLFSREVQTMVELPALLAQVLDMLTAIFNCAYSAVYLLDGSETVALAASRDLPPDATTHETLSQVMLGRFRRGDVLEGEATFAMLVPLRMQRSNQAQLVGVLALGPRRRGLGYSIEDRRLAASIAAQVSTAIYVADLANRERQRLEEIGRLQNEFLATVSHELRTPLHTIIGYTDALLTELDGPLNEEQRGFEESVMQNADRLLNLIEDLLDIARIEAQRMRIERQPVDPRAWAEKLCTPFRRKAAERGLDFELILDPSLPESLMLDTERLNLVAGKLISNAIKFTEKGELRVRLSYQAGRLQVLVADSGIGIAPADLPHIFEPFYQAESGLMRSYGGAGLGLTLAQRISDLMDGRIQVESRPGEGSQFRLEVPAPISPERAATALPIQREVPS